MLRVVPDLDTGVVPPVEAVPHVAAIVERDSLFEHGGSGTQDEFHRPLHSVHAINIADLNDALPSSFFAECEIDWRKSDPVMRNRKVELDAKRRPRARDTDLPLS